MARHNRCYCPMKSTQEYLSLDIEILSMKSLGRQWKDYWSIERYTFFRRARIVWRKWMNAGNVFTERSESNASFVRPKSAVWVQVAQHDLTCHLRKMICCKVLISILRINLLPCFSKSNFGCFVSLYQSRLHEEEIKPNSAMQQVDYHPRSY